MSAPRMTKTRAKATRAPAAGHVRTNAISTLQFDPEPLPDMPFAEGIDDILGADLRHRLVSEAAYHHFAERGYAEGSEIDDWSQAEAEIDHTLVDRPFHRR